MLQPLQLKEVSVRYAAEIAELQDFLAKAGLPVGTAETVGIIAARLPRDRAFHRDLTSYIWVAIDNRHQQISYADLLGILVLAAAGERFAHTADEDETHNLLRFVIEAKHSLDGTATTETKAPPEPEPQPIFNKPVRLLEAEETYEEKPENDGKKIIFWIAIVACLLTAILTGFWLHNRSTNNTATSNTTTPQPEPTNPQPTTQYNEQATQAPTANQTTTNQTPTENRATTNQASAKPARSTEPAHAPTITARNTTPAPVIRSTPQYTPSPATTTTQQTINKPKPTAPTATMPRIAKSAAPATQSAVPSSALSARVGTRSMPTDLTPYGIDNKGRKYPVLKRRSTTQYTQDSGTQIADARLPFANAPNNASPTPKGIVRAGSEGIMSANLIFSPSPAYPGAAATAHIQGQVKIRATVDRDGTVASVSVISGPPALRDAALDAVQHWRFNPRTAGGKAVTAIATAVLDFELQ